MTGFPLYILNFLLYGLLSVHFWRSRWRTVATPEQPRPEKVRSWEKAAILLPLSLHTVLLYHSLLGATGLNLGVGNAISAIVWLTVLTYWLASFRSNMEGLQTMVLSVAALSVMLPAMLPVMHTIPYSEMHTFKAQVAHLMMALLAYSLFTIAAMHALLMIVVERRLHSGAMPVLMQNLPPVLTMERLLFRIVWAGFILLTLTLVSGALFSEEIFHKPLQFSHKIVFAIISWAIFGALLGGRHIYGWRGRTATRWTLAGFATLLLAYIGSKFVLEVLLNR